MRERIVTVTCDICGKKFDDSQINGIMTLEKTFPRKDKHGNRGISRSCDICGDCIAKIYETFGMTDKDKEGLERLEKEEAERKATIEAEEKITTEMLEAAVNKSIANSPKEGEKENGNPQGCM